HGCRVGTGTHDEVVVTARRHRRPDPADHRVGVDHGLAVQVSAPLRVDLVLQVAAGEPGLLQRLDRAGGVHRLTETGVGVDDGRQIGDPGDLVATPRHLGERGQTDVGQSELGGDHRTGDVHPLETQLLDEYCGERVHRAGYSDDPARGELLAQTTSLLVR